MSPQTLNISYTLFKQVFRYFELVELELGYNAFLVVVKTRKKKKKQVVLDVLLWVAIWWPNHLQVDGLAALRFAN